MTPPPRCEGLPRAVHGGADYHGPPFSEEQRRRYPIKRPSWSVLGAGLALAPLALASTSALAQESSALPDRVSLRLGGYYASVDTDVRVAAPRDTLSGTINLEDDLGFDQDKTVPREHLMAG